MGVPAGTDGSLMSIWSGVVYTQLPAADAFDLPDGLPPVSAAHVPPVADTWSPPALTRSTTVPAAPTVSWAALLVAAPLALLNTARYFLPLSAVWATTLNAGDV